MNSLDLFGKEVIEKVRDISIQDWDNIIELKTKGVTADAVKEKLSSFSDEQLEVLKWILPKIVDTSIHNFLWMFDRSKNIDLKVTTEDGVVERLQEESDGLYGELYSRRGWIKKYSKERYDEL